MFYPPGSVEQLGQRVAQSGAVEKLAADWRIPNEIAYDLAKLSLFDLVILADDSGSMSFGLYTTYLCIWTLVHWAADRGEALISRRLLPPCPSQRRRASVSLS